MFYVYIGCLTFGVLYTFLSVVSGSHGFDRGTMNYSGFYGEEAPSMLNPVIIAGAVAAFGVGGMIGMHILKIPELASVVFSIFCAAGTGAFLLFCMTRFFYRRLSALDIPEEAIVNVEAEVLIPIPTQGTGEVSYTIKGMRRSLSARSKHNEFLGRGEAVIIQHIENYTAFVVPKENFHGTL